MTTNISLLITGSEILDGRVRDTNSHLLMEKLSEAGLQVRHSLSCNDTVSDIVRCLEFLCADSSTVIVSGGLGPTSDDLTSQAIAQFAGKGLVLNQEALTELKERFAKRRRAFNVENEKQAYVPEGATVIRNPVGTAPGFQLLISKWRNAGERLVIALPGVPIELERMSDDSVIPQLRERIFGSTPNTQSLAVKAMRIFGLSEAEVGSRIRSLALPDSVIVSYRTHFPEIQVLLKASRAIEINEPFCQAKKAVGEEYIFAESLALDFEAVVHHLLLDRGLTISTAESCTGGLIGKLLSDTPGASAYFTGGVVTYTNSAKVSLLQVPETLIGAHGAVSCEVAQSMALGCRTCLNSDIGISVTGIAGPDGGSEEKPVGLFFVGYCDKTKSCAYKYFFSSSRNYVRSYAAYTALDIVRRELLGLPQRHLFR